MQFLKSQVFSFCSLDLLSFCDKLSLDNIKKKRGKMMKETPNALLWIFQTKDLVKKKYLKDLDFIKNNTSVNYVAISPREGVHLQNLQQCHEVIKEIVEYAHQIGLKICLHLVTAEGFYNALFTTNNHPAVDQVAVFPIPDPKKAQAIVNDIELVADDDGYAEYTYQAIWGRSKIMPIRSEVLKAYSFEKTDEGFYVPDSLQDVTQYVRITNTRTNITEFEIDLGKENKGKNIFVLLAQYYNFTAVSEEWGKLKELIDGYSDIPLDGVVMDEFGYLPLNTNPVCRGEEPPFRGRMYSKQMKQYYKDTLNIDLDRMLFDMRYAPLNDEKVRIRAINKYFEELRHFPLEVEKKVYAYSKKIFGEDIYVSCHNTFHNNLDNDEIWHTACNWWDIPRDFGHTDENIGFPVRWGVMLACKNPIMIDMYYSKNFENHYDHIIEGAPFNCREFHHAYADFYWGSSFTEPEFVEKIKKLDTDVAQLNDFQTVYPKMDLLVVYGAAAQNNWYPDYDARNIWDIDGTLKIMNKCNEMWNAGYRCALVPDYAIEDGRITQKGDKIYFNDYEFSHCLFLYPKYAKKGTYEFLNKCDESGVKIAVVGKNGIDFDGNEVTLTAKNYEEYSLEILGQIGCNKSAIEGGCVYEDGSFALVSKGILDQSVTDFEFVIDGITYRGKHTGILAYRKDKISFATKGSKLFADDVEVELNYMQ